MKDLKNLPGIRLSRQELSKLGGGELPTLAGSGTFTCRCSSHRGSWTANYGTQEKADASLERNCADGKGSCKEH